MNKLIALYNEHDIDETFKKIQNKELKDYIKSKYPNCNEKILLSSIIIKNFYVLYNLHENNSLVYNAKQIALNLINNCDSMIGYDKYYQEFCNWRQTDITTIQNTILSTVKELRNTSFDNPNSEADVQWNNGVESSINIMNKYIEDLDKLSKSPPN